MSNSNVNTSHIGKRQSHLEYYQQHGIAPVRYDLSSLDAHFDRRRSLYNKLGLTSLAFAGAHVLEVAAGTGHNSLYIAAQHPISLTLLEPNPTAIDHIKSTYAGFKQSHTVPKLITDKLEVYEPSECFDIVLCENWLGTSPHELTLLSKLTRFLTPGGILVITTVSPIGLVPNLLRRYFSCHLAPPTLPFSQRTELLVNALGSHLSRLGGMTRNVADWVHDNMMNPAYFALCLSAPAALAHLGERFEVVGTYPSFIEDWRWFKSLHGSARAINEHFLSEYWKKCHNFFDSMQASTSGDFVLNQAFEHAAEVLLRSIEASEDAVIHAGDVEQSVALVHQRFLEFVSFIPQTLSETKEAIAEIMPLVRTPLLVTADRLAGLTQFSGLFGRETSYLALQLTNK